MKSLYDFLCPNSYNTLHIVSFLLLFINTTIGYVFSFVLSANIAFEDISLPIGKSLQRTSSIPFKYRPPTSILASYINSIKSILYPIKLNKGCV